MGRRKGSLNSRNLPPVLAFSETERLQLIANLILDLLSEDETTEG